METVEPLLGVREGLKSVFGVREGLASNDDFLELMEAEATTGILLGLADDADSLPLPLLAALDDDICCRKRPYCILLLNSSSMSMLCGLSLGALFGVRDGLKSETLEVKEEVFVVVGIFDDEVFLSGL